VSSGRVDWWNSHPTAAARSRGGLDEYQTLLRLPLYETPHLLDLRRLNPASLYRDRLRTAALPYGLINVREDEGFFFIRQSLC
jgi:hypothetical protein